MMLSGHEATALLKGLISAFPNSGKLDIVLARPPIERNLALITRPDALDVMYFALVQAANREGWMEQFLAGLRTASQVNPALIALIDSFAGMRPRAAVAPHLELVLDGAPFVNQHPLRHALKSMALPVGGPKVLHVTGQKASGKSYSQHLIAHIAQRNQIAVYLAPALEATTTARTVMEDLAMFLRLGKVPLPPDHPQDSTAVARMVRWLAAEARDLDRDWWLVFDGFDSPKVDDSVLMLMTGMAQSIGVGQPDRLRLFLLAWDRSISGPPPGRVFEQGLQAFDRSHVKIYLEDLVGQFRMPAGFANTDEILDLCYEGWETVQDPLDRAATLTRRLQKVVEAATIGGGAP